MSMMSKTLRSLPKAVGTKGLKNAFVYSFGSFLVSAVLAYVAESPEAAEYLLKLGVSAPIVNVLVVLIKQMRDEMVRGTNAE